MVSAEAVKNPDISGSRMPVNIMTVHSVRASRSRREVSSRQGCEYPKTSRRVGTSRLDHSEVGGTLDTEPYSSAVRVLVTGKRVGLCAYFGDDSLKAPGSRSFEGNQRGMGKSSSPLAGGIV